MFSIKSKIKFLIVIMFININTLSYSQGIEQDSALSLINRCTKVLKLNPYNFECLYIRGSSYLELDSIDLAITDFEKLININRNLPDIYNSLSYLYYKKTNYYSSIICYNKAIKLDSTNEEYYLGRGVDFEFLKNYNQALNDYNKSVYLNPKCLQCLINRANLYSEKLNDPMKSIADWDKLIELNPDAGNFNDRGLVNMKLGKYRIAIFDFNSAIDLNNSRALYYINRGYAYGKLTNFDKAFSDFDKAIQIDKNNPLIYQKRGMIYIEQKNQSKGCEDLKKSTELGLSNEYYNKYCN